MKKSINKPKVSVIMSAYNAEKYIGKAIESILNQTLRDFELIIVDDASKDKTLEIIREYSKLDDRIIILRNLKNRYASASRNKGIKIAKGKYISIMDADDISLSKRLEIQYNYLEKYKEIFLVGGSFQYIDEKGKKLSTKINDYNSDTLERKLPHKSMIHNPTIMFRNNKKTFYREKVFYSEDRDLFLRLLSEKKKMVVIPNVLIKYRLYGDSISTTNRLKQKLFIEKVIKWYLQREKYGRDDYEDFDKNEILKIEEGKVSGKILVELVKLKLVFKSEKDMKLFRKLLKDFWKKFGFSLWKQGAVYYMVSYFPKPVVNIFLKLLEKGKS